MVGKTGGQFCASSVTGSLSIDQVGKLQKISEVVTNSVVATSSMQHSWARPLAVAAASAFVTRRAEWADPTNSGTPRERDTPAYTSNAHIIAVALTRIYARCWDQIRAREQNPFTHQERRGPRCCLFTPPVGQ